MDKEYNSQLEYILEQDIDTIFAYVDEIMKNKRDLENKEFYKFIKKSKFRK